jgi:hypothetical protein
MAAFIPLLIRLSSSAGDLAPETFYGFSDERL